MKHLIIGDIHGDTYVVQAALNNFPDHRPIFVGDFMDSFTNSVPKQIECVRQVIAAARSGRAVVLFGNHEFSYLEPRRLKASGHNPIADAHFIHLGSDVRKHFKPFVYFPQNRVLVTHAGLTKQVWDKHNLTFDNLESTLTDWFHECPDSPFYQIGRARGGIDRWGGPLWCDYQAEFVPVPGLTQVFGHSASAMPRGNETHLGKRIRVCEENNYNIDCLQYTIEALEFNDETGTFSAVDL